MLPESVQKAVAKVRQLWDPQYEAVVNHFTPWAPLKRPLSSSRIAMISSAGVYLRNRQEPFDAGNPLGDPTFREIPGDAAVTGLSIAHDHYDHSLGEEDLNVVFPLDRLRTLVEAGEIGELAPVHYSFMGYCTRQLPLAADYGPEVARRLQAAGVDGALMVAV